MIVSAAVKVYFDPGLLSWKIVPVHRHKDCKTILDMFQIKFWICEDGFLTDQDHFLSRRQALDHAIACGQVDPESPVGEDIVRSGMLFSEDLW